MKADREADYDQAVKPRVAATYLGAAGHDQLAGRHGLLALVAMIGGVIGLYGWLMFVMAFDHNGPFGSATSPPVLTTWYIGAPLGRRWRGTSRCWPIR